MIRILSMAAGALAIAACGTTNAPPQFYTLAAPSYEGTEAPGATLVAYVGPVTVPEAVDRPQMVMSKGANEVELADGHRWAEPLKDAIPRVVAANLMQALGTRRVSGSRMASGLPADYRIALDVQRFDSTPTGSAVDVLWIVRAANGEMVRTGRTQAREAGGSAPGEIAAAHGRALAKVARDIATAIRGR